MDQNNIGFTTEVYWDHSLFSYRISSNNRQASNKQLNQDAYGTSMQTIKQ